MVMCRIARRALPVLWALGVTLAVVAVAGTAAADPFIPIWQPDGRIRLSRDDAAIGDDIYNDTGEDQTRTAAVRPRRKGRFVVAFQHDGEPIDDTWLVTGPRATPGFKVKYKSDGVDVTDAVTAGTFQQTVGSGGVAAAIRAKVKVKASAPSTATKTLPITARSLINGDDTVRARVRVK